LGEYGLDSLYKKAAVQYITSNPLKVANLIPAKIYRLFAHVVGFKWINDSLHNRIWGETVIIYSGYIIENEYYYLLMFSWIITLLYVIVIHKTKLLSAIEIKLPLIIIFYFLFIYGVVFWGTLYYNLIFIPFIIMSLGQNLILIKEAVSRSQ
jgi:hypothetical protein